MKIIMMGGATVNPGDISWAPIEALGELTILEDLCSLSPEAVTKLVQDADILIANDVTVSAEMIDACTKLKYIPVMATGYDMVDHAYARKKGIPVSNVPAYGTMAVAQHTIALLLELTNHVGHYSTDVAGGSWQRAGDWCYWDEELTELAGKTIGIVGFGNIGRQVGRIASALGMRVLAWNRSTCEDGLKIGSYVDLETIWRESDVISLHVPMSSDTAGLICKETLAQMKDGVILLNTSRGGLVNEADLKEALLSGKVAAAGLDVLAAEPMRDDCALAGLKNCLITPHVAWAAQGARQRIIDITANNIRSFLSGATKHVVN